MSQHPGAIPSNSILIREGVRKMKKLLLMSLVFFLGSALSFSQPGKNCFNTQFHKDAVNLDPVNAYLMGYLATMIYPNYGIRFFFNGPGYEADGDSVGFLEAHNDKFNDVFADKLGYLFIDKDAPPALLKTTAVGLGTPVSMVSGLSRTTAGAGTTEPNVVTVGAPNGQQVIFDYQNKCNPAGYDPEAIIISTSTTIYVVFRGTDRVSCNPVGSLGYNVAEWAASDFQFLKRDASVLGPNIHGGVHRGMAQSLLFGGFADSVATRIRDRYHGAGKRVWITGHSLGGGHAQLFALFLKHNYGITPQGVYLYESPHPGDQTFVDQLNTDIGKNRIQRFEFLDDPIPTLPPQAFLFGRAGVRNYFKDVSSNVESGHEQIPLIDDAKIFCAIGNLPADEIPQLPVKLEFVAGCGGTTCYHDPDWVLRALRHQVPSSLFPSLPADLPLPVKHCTALQRQQGAQNDLINNAATDFESFVINSVSNLSFTAGLIADNMLDKAIAEGNYELICYKFRNDLRNALEWPSSERAAGTAESKLRIRNGLTTANKVFHVEHDVLGGAYRISMAAGNNDKFFIEIPFFGNGDNGTLTQMQKYHPYDGQIWFFYKIPNTPVYVLYNKLSHKVMDAYDNCPNSTADCKVQQYDMITGDQSQLWILRRMN
ncbi:MAG: hypothetical protein E6K56_04150 [Ignavibacteria bacterium]|nr:MAG: hypothetical protein E6K56_04150 [Ignavibacteria bacterium]